MTEFAFKRGLDHVPLGKVKQAKKELMEALNITTRVSWSKRLRGLIEPKVTEAEAIEQVFARYGIKKDQIWG